jgi:hypothetical protein
LGLGVIAAGAARLGVHEAALDAPAAAALDLAVARPVSHALRSALDQLAEGDAGAGCAEFTDGRSSSWGCFDDLAAVGAGTQIVEQIDRLQ